MWRFEWIWQTYRWVRVTSSALGLVTHDLTGLLVVLLLVLVKIRLKLADDVPFHLLGVRANVIKIACEF